MTTTCPNCKRKIKDDKRRKWFRCKCGTTVYRESSDKDYKKSE